jgi:hypothetical protein
LGKFRDSLDLFLDFSPELVTRAWDVGVIFIYFLYGFKSSPPTLDRLPGCGGKALSAFGRDT